MAQQESLLPKMLKGSAKLLLLNSVRSARIHNRRLEEEELWQRRSTETSHHGHRRDRSQSPIHRRRNSERARRRKPDEKSPRRERTPSNVWLRRLTECKEADPGKWHHDGFKELYPDALEEKAPAVVLVEQKSHYRDVDESGVIPRSSKSKSSDKKRKNSRHSRKSGERREKNGSPREERKHKKKRKKERD